MTHFHRSVATSALLLSAIRLSAQEPQGVTRPVTPGDTVRLHENRIVMVHGILQRRDSTGLVVVDRVTRDTVHIPLFQITRAEVQRGSHRRGATAVGNGAAVGALIGGVIVALSLFNPDQHDAGVGVFVSGLAAIVVTGIGTAVGTVAAMTSTETWVPFDPAAVPFPSSAAPALPPDDQAISTST